MVEKKPENLVFCSFFVMSRLGPKRHMPKNDASILFNHRQGLSHVARAPAVMR